MSTLHKRTIFFTMTLLFFIYTFFIATSATEHDKGKEYLTPSADEGKLLFQQYNCIACHQIYGLGGYMGPDLTNVYSGKGKGEGYIRTYLKYGSARMPDFKLSDDQITALTDYLKYIDKTGLSPVMQFTLNNDGSVTYAGK